LTHTTDQLIDTPLGQLDLALCVDRDRTEHEEIARLIGAKMPAA